jgi:hypothetical protein
MHLLLSPLMSSEYIEEFVLDTMEFVKTIDEVRNGTYVYPPGVSPITRNSKPFTFDVVAMYPNIPWQKGADECGFTVVFLFKDHSY